MNTPSVPGQAVSAAPSVAAAPIPVGGASAAGADDTAGSEWSGR